MNSTSKFAISFKRVLYLSVLIGEACEHLNQEEETPSHLAAQAFGIQKSVERMYNFARKFAPESWAIIEKDLNGDHLTDTFQLLDEAFEIKNVGEIVEQIRAWKNEDRNS